MKPILLRAMALLAGYAAIQSTAQAASTCQVQITNNSGSIQTLNVDASKNKSYNKTLKKAYVMASGNNAHLEVILGGSGTYVSYYVQSNGTLELPESSKLKRILCHPGQTKGSSTSLKPSIEDVINNMKSKPTKAAKALKDLFNMGETEIAKRLRQANVSRTNVLKAIKNVFGNNATVAKRGIKGILQASSDVKLAIQAAKSAFGNTVTGKRVAKWLKDLGYGNTPNQRKLIVETLEQQFNANREQAEQYLQQAQNWASSHIQAALDAVYGVVQLSAQEIAQQAKQQGKTANWALQKMKDQLSIPLSDMCRWLRKAGYSAQQIAQAVAQVYGTANAHLLALLQGLRQAGVDAYDAGNAARTAFGKSATGQNLTAALADAGYTGSRNCQALAKLAKDGFKASRKLAEQWLAATNKFTDSQVQAAIDAIYGIAVQVTKFMEGESGVKNQTLYNPSTTARVRVWGKPPVNYWTLEGSNVGAIDRVIGLPTAGVSFTKRSPTRLDFNFYAAGNARSGTVEFFAGKTRVFHMQWERVADRQEYQKAQPKGDTRPVRTSPKCPAGTVYDGRGGCRRR